MRILWICFVWPEPNSSAAGVRTTQLIELSRSKASQICVVSPCQENLYKTELEKQGIRTEVFPPNDARFDEFIKEFQPEVVFFDRFMIEEQFSWRIRAICPNAIRILDSVDIHALRRHRQALVESSESAEFVETESLIQHPVQNVDFYREISAILRSDITLMISDYESSLLCNFYGVKENKLFLLPHAYLVKNSQLPAFGERKDFVSIGNFNHPPNFDALKLLKLVIWPKILKVLSQRGLEGSVLQIYGAYPNQSALQLDDSENGFRVRGRAVDVCTTLSNFRLNLAPLRFGAGIKGKVLDGWCAGTPCIGTSIALEGICESDEFGGVVSNQIDEYCLKAAELYLDQSAWQQAQSRGVDVVNTYFSFSLLQQRFDTLFELIVDCAHAQRKTDFFCQLLWYQANRSTEYFSRWIELKNTVNN